MELCNGGNLKNYLENSNLKNQDGKKILEEKEVLKILK